MSGAPRRRVLWAALAAALVCAVAARGLLAPRALVVIGTRFAGPAGVAPSLRPGQPFRALLARGRAIGQRGFVDFELHQLAGDVDRMTRVIPIAVDGRDDEVIFAVADVVHLVGPLRGNFRVVFAHDGAALGEGRFSVDE